MPLRSLITHIGILALTLGSLFVILQSLSSPLPAPVQEPAQTASAAQTASSSATITAAESVATSSQATTTSVKKASPRATKTVAAKPTQGEAVRVRNPYTTPPLNFSDINLAVRQSLVNILCYANGGSLRPISGSGVVIDPRGVILTNAHVAQYVLLSQSGRLNLSCVVRTGSPAVARYTAQVLFVPPIWVKEHAADLMLSHPVGTGEHDYALLLITGTTDGSALPASLPALAVDTREAIGFVGDQVMSAGYPAEFLGGIGTQASLYPSTSISAIRQLLTFSTQSVDVISVGGTIQAQAGSSGGAVTNAWGRLIGVITTTTEGATTAERDLRAVTLSYINRDLLAQRGLDLSLILGGDVALQAAEFKKAEAPVLTDLLIAQIVR